MTRTYQSAAAFKQALEARIRASSVSGVDFARRRQLLVFDRFLARVAVELGDAATLKGGLALELRVERARTTKDVDLRVTGSPDQMLERLRAAGRLNLGDFMVFTIQQDPQHPQIQNDGMPYDGMRFRAECTLAGKGYGSPFGVDVAFGDLMTGEPDVIVASDSLAFAGIAPPALRVYPVETHVAEKLHAYTMPRDRPNSRVKDLPDMCLLAAATAIEANRLRAALDATFSYRGTHAIPARLPEPPAAWVGPYAAIANEERLPWPTLDDMFLAARAFLDPALAAVPKGTWAPDLWLWLERAK